MVSRKYSALPSSEQSHDNVKPNYPLMLTDFGFAKQSTSSYPFSYLSLSLYIPTTVVCCGLSFRIRRCKAMYLYQKYVVGGVCDAEAYARISVLCPRASRS